MNKKIVFSIILLNFTAYPALAKEPEIFSPEVRRGELEAEYLGYFGTGDESGNWEQEAAVSYGITDMWATEIEAGFAKESEEESEDGEEEGDEAGEESSDDDVEFEALTWRNIVELTDQAEAGVGVGLLGQFEHNFVEDSNAVEARLLLEKDIGRFENLANFNIAYEIDEGETSGGFDFRSRYAAHELFKPGVELFTDFGDENDHRAGPMIYGERAGFEYQAGYLFGLNDDAPDGTIKVGLAYRL